MEHLAKWMGLIKAVNHTGRWAYFKTLKGGTLRYICDVKDFDPRVNKSVYTGLMDVIVERGAEITVHHKNLKNNATMRYEAVMEINKQIYRAIGASCQPAIVNCIRKYIENLGKDAKLGTT